MKKSLVVFLVALCFVWMGGKAYADNDDAFLKASQAYTAHDADRFARQASRVDKKYVLYPYIEYWRISSDLEVAGDAAVADFLASHSGSWLAEKLRSAWLKELGRREFWQAFVPEYARLSNPDLTLQCYAHLAELASGDLSNLRTAVGLWFNGNDMPPSCTSLFSQLISLGYINQEDVWRRFDLALASGNPGVAKSVATALPPEIRPDANAIDLAGADPAGFIRNSDLDFDRRGNRELLIYAVGQLASSDPDLAAQLLSTAEKKLPEQDRRDAWGRLAYYSSRLHNPKALEWFERAGMGALSDAEREWWARAALRAGQWHTVFDVINSMGPDTQNKATWRYWKARALEAMGQSHAADLLLVPLSREYRFYGQLATEELHQSIGMPVNNIQVSGDEILSAKKNPGIARALALYKLGLRSDATDEWKWAIRNDGDKELLAAAELARQHQWFDRAIDTAERTRDQHNFDLRFLSPFRDQASAYAREYQLDEAWVYGVIRQESRFTPEARSSAGALGLMQLMPSTVRWIARKLGLRRTRGIDAHDPETNIKFGAYYLRTLLDSLDNQPVLATAGYNAGPRRAQRWRDGKPMEAAIYIETIPFSETREYVKKVMSNAMYYAMRFGQPSQLLKDRLGVIPGLGETLPAGGDDKSPSLEDDEDAEQ
jgi:soluble lytic murein transglycosylase